jgi:hypothetical protein
MSADSNQITKTPALNPRKAPADRKGESSMAHCGYERLDGGKRELEPYSNPDRRGLSEPVYPRQRVYDDN